MYDMIYCDGVTAARIVLTGAFRYNNHVFDLGGGVYAIQNTDTKLTVFDAFGDTLSVIEMEDNVSLVRTANGLLCLSGPDGPEFMCYTQTGIELPAP